MVKYIHNKIYFLSELSAGILIGFSCFLMTSVMPISPIYFAFLLAAYLFLLKMRWVNIPNESIFIYTPHILLAFYYTLNAFINRIDMHIGTVMSFFALYYIFSDIFLYQITKKEIFKSVVKKYYLINCLLDNKLAQYTHDFLCMCYQVCSLSTSLLYICNPVDHLSSLLSLSVSQSVRMKELENH
jgi:hypothetical protein